MIRSLARSKARAIPRPLGLPFVRGGGVVLPPITSIAFVGDSITAQGLSTVTAYGATGYATWARIFGGSQWDAVANGSALSFATGSFTSLQVQSTHLPNVIASSATKCVVSCGINDHAAGRTSAQTVATLREIWASLTAAGIKPIAATITPHASDAAKQVWIADTNILIRSAAIDDGVTLCDWASVLETSPGVGSTTTLPDNVHPNQLGASRLGRVLAATLAAIPIRPKVNYSDDDVWLTANILLAGAGGQPTSWLAPTVPSGAVLILLC